MRKFALMLSVFILMASLVFAQVRNVTGKVTDDKGLPVAGAAIQAKGTKIGTVSTTDGTFTLTIPTSVKTLIISAVNAESTEVGVAGNLTITLKPVTGSLSEVVVVAYGQIKKTNITGSITTVKAADIEDNKDIWKQLLTNTDFAQWIKSKYTLVGGNLMMAEADDIEDLD